VRRLLALALVLAGTGLSAQTFRSNILTVPVTVTVVDANGRLITGLAQEDFELLRGRHGADRHHLHQRTRGLEPGRAARRERQHARPEDDRRRHGRGALRRRSPAGEDEAFIGLFNHRPRLASAWTRPPSSLKDRLANVQPTGGTAIYDAVASRRRCSTGEASRARRWW
jgi:hypothetical protein